MMSSNLAVSVENLSKMYRIGGKQEAYSTLRDTLVDAVASPFRRARGLLRGESASGLKEEIWALKDVSFEVKHGEVIGVIGSNGAGKSTLLKILSRITEPTTGSAKVYGRVGALLEVGTGFHPELTGRENVYLNGAILGMSRKDIDRKFEEIVEFAEIEKFIDTPVKHYSSGMGLRLGFAVAAHLEPEILVVDEVLAVGDAEFQKKCLGKMSEVSGQGRTVLFVSHNMGAVSRITERCVWLNKGAIVEIGTTDDIVFRYLENSSKSRDVGTGTFQGEKDGVIELLKVEVLSEAGELLNRPLFFGECFSLHTTWRAKTDLQNAAVFARVEASDGSILTTLNTRDKDLEISVRNEELVSATWTSKYNPLMPGHYFLTFAVHGIQGVPVNQFWHVAEIQVTDVGGPPRLSRNLSRAGYVYVDGSWTYEITEGKSLRDDTLN